VLQTTGGARVGAMAQRAAFNSRFRPGTLDRVPVAVRMTLDLQLDKQ